jgi:magnesium transporter
MNYMFLLNLPVTHSKIMKAKKIQYADDDVTSVGNLIKMRIPSLVIGIILGIVLSFVASRFEEVLTRDIKVAFFIPFIVYMAAAVGSQTQNIYSRDLKSGKASFKMYLLKETFVGIFLAGISSLASVVITFLWFASIKLTLAVALAMFASIAVAPLVALLVTEVLQLERTDPAVGAGPIATIIQDTLSVFIYGLIASAIIL